MKPQYPAAAKGAKGFVTVRVLIDETGNVIEAKGTCGIQEFLKASEKAALHSKFSPTVLNRQPVKVSGIIVYFFGK